MTDALTLPATPSATPPPAASTSYRWRWPALAVILTGSVMEMLDSTVTSIAGPTVRADLGGGASLIQWLGVAYTLAMTAGLLVGGRLGDIAGRKRMFLIGAGGFVAGSLLCAFATGPEMVIAARAMQGLFGACMIPQGLGTLKEMFPPRGLQAALGAMGPVMGLSAVGGPTLAGWLVERRPERQAPNGAPSRPARRRQSRRRPGAARRPGHRSLASSSAQAASSSTQAGVGVSGVEAMLSPSCLGRGGRPRLGAGHDAGESRPPLDVPASIQESASRPRPGLRSGHPDGLRAGGWGS